MLLGFHTSTDWEVDVEHPTPSAPLGQEATKEGTQRSTNGRDHLDNGHVFSSLAEGYQVGENDVDHQSNATAAEALATFVFRATV